MTKTKIEWCNYTWNPVTGCLHNCPYCYAAKMVKRFAGKDYSGEFKPMFHSNRLEEPKKKIKTPQNVFVCSMADLFGDWVPDEWIQQVLDACKAAPQHRYLFLTKNPERYSYINCDGQTREGCKKCNGCEGEHRILTIYCDNDEPFPELFFGASATDSDSMYKAYETAAEWVSIEPLLDEVYNEWFMQDGETPSGYREWARWKWVVIGAESGNRKNKVTPKKEWIQSIVEQCRFYNTPVFMKNSLAPIWEEPLIQEYPW
jgi:protein gp37